MEKMLLYLELPPESMYLRALKSKILKCCQILGKLQETKLFSKLQVLNMLLTWVKKVSHVPIPFSFSGKQQLRYSDKYIIVCPFD